MARYIREFTVNADFQTIHNAVSQYLMITEGYEFTVYDGENVFKKGDGWVSGPTIFKFSYYGNTVRLETWMKYALLPGVFVGEIGTTGFVGCAAKGPWKARIQQVEAIIWNFIDQNVVQAPPISL